MRKKNQYSEVNKDKLKECLLILSEFYRELLTAIIIDEKSIEDTCQIMAAYYQGVGPMSRQTIEKYKNRGLAQIALHLLKNTGG